MADHKSPSKERIAKCEEDIKKSLDELQKISNAFEVLGQKELSNKLDFEIAAIKFSFSRITSGMMGKLGL